MRIYGELKDNILTIQPAEYIEDGWYIELHNNIWYLFEIPLGGGEPELIKKTNVLSEAIEHALRLT